MSNSDPRETFHKHILYFCIIYWWAKLVRFAESTRSTSGFIVLTYIIQYRKVLQRRNLLKWQECVEVGHTFAVWKPVVILSARVTLSPNDVRLATTLSSKLRALEWFTTESIALTSQSSVVVFSRHRKDGRPTEWWNLSSLSTKPVI